MSNRLDRWTARRFPKVHDFLHTKAEIVHLLKATLPLWITTILAAAAGFIIVINQRVDQCERGRGDIAEFMHRVIDLNPNVDPARLQVFEQLIDDFLDDCQ